MTTTTNPRNKTGEIATLVADKRHEIVKGLNDIDHWGDASKIRLALNAAVSELIALDAEICRIDSGD